MALAGDALPLGTGEDSPQQTQPAKIEAGPRKWRSKHRKKR